MEDIRSLPLAAVLAASLLNGCAIDRHTGASENGKPVMPPTMLVPLGPSPAEISFLHQTDFSITATPDAGIILDEIIAGRIREVAECVFRLSNFPEFEGRRGSNGHAWAQIQFDTRRGDRYRVEVRNYRGAMRDELHFWLQRAIGGHEIHMVDNGLDGNVNLFETSEKGARALPIYERTMFRNAIDEALKVCKVDRTKEAGKRRRMRRSGR